MISQKGKKDKKLYSFKSEFSLRLNILSNVTEQFVNYFVAISAASLRYFATYDKAIFIICIGKKRKSRKTNLKKAKLCKAVLQNRGWNYTLTLKENKQA